MCRPTSVAQNALDSDSCSRQEGDACTDQPHPSFKYPFPTKRSEIRDHFFIFSNLPESIKTIKKSYNVMFSLIKTPYCNTNPPVTISPLFWIFLDQLIYALFLPRPVLPRGFSSLPRPTPPRPALLLLLQISASFVSGKKALEAK